jgi:LysM repeat protein
LLTLALGVASVNPAFAAQGVTYQVKRGDTLYSIARQHQTTVSNVALSNQLANTRVLAVGQILTIPIAAPFVAPVPIPVAAPISVSPASSVNPSLSVDPLLADALAPAVDLGSEHCPAFVIDNGIVQRALGPCHASAPLGLPAVVPIVPPAVAPVASAPAAGTAVLSAPYHSQFDGTAYAETNCGPTALSMALGALNISADQQTLRRLANVQLGTSDPNSGTTWASLAYAAQAKGAKVSGPYVGQGASRRSWTIDDLKSELAQGHPVLLLVKYRSLPGNAQSAFGSDHFIVALGVDRSGNIIYNDPAYTSSAGAHRTISPAELTTAWTNTAEGLVRTAMAIST